MKNPNFSYLNDSSFDHGQTWIPCTREWSVPSSVEIGPVVFKICQSIFAISLLSPLGEGCSPSFEQTWIPFTQRCFLSSLVEIGPVVLEILFVWGFFCPTGKLFTHMETSCITGERLQLMTYAWYSWPLSNESSLACHTYCNTGYPFLMVISENPRHTPISERLVGSCHFLF